MLLVPDDGRVPVHRGMCFFEIFYFICRHGKPGAVAGYRRQEASQEAARRKSIEKELEWVRQGTKGRQ
nr:hypothetical protein [Escherichia coli]